MAHIQRRRLFAATTAVTLASGIVAGLAASVADHVEPSGDALLIGLCGRYVAADQEHEAACDRQQEIGTSKAPEWALLDDVASRWGLIMMDLEPQIAELAALTPAGVQAKARAVARITRLYKEDNGAGMVRSLLADLMRDGAA